MKIKIGDVKFFASRTLELLEHHGIQSCGDLEKLLHKRCSVEKTATDYIWVDMHPPTDSTGFYIVSYINPGIGIPIELRINTNYSHITVKAQQLIKGYLPYSTDLFKNITQKKILDSSDISLSKKELIMLSKLE